MLRGDHTFAISMALSLVVHAAIAATLIHDFQPVAQFSAAPTTAPVSTPRIFIDDRTDAAEGFGLADGRGQAANESPGEKPMVGPDAEHQQAFLSRDPVGPGNVGDDPSMSVLPRTAAMQLAAAGAGEAAAMIGAASPSASQIIPPRTKTPLPGQDDTSLTRTKDSPLARPQQVAGGGGAPGSPLPAADPAVMSDSESDPFAPGMKVEFSDGRVEARLGRKVKTVRPKLTLAAKYDLMSSGAPSMKVRVRVDTEGAVREVDILKSSGSDSADQAVKVALYQWWFEPKKDEGGNAIASIVTFPIVWR